jgi:hypothetical protein
MKLFFVLQKIVFSKVFVKYGSTAGICFNDIDLLKQCAYLIHIGFAHCKGVGINIKAKMLV